VLSFSLGVSVTSESECNYIIILQSTGLSTIFVLIMTLGLFNRETNWF